MAKHKPKHTKQSGGFLRMLDRLYFGVRRRNKRSLIETIFWELVRNAFDVLLQDGFSHPVAELVSRLLGG